MIQNFVFDLKHVLFDISFDSKAQKNDIPEEEYTFFKENILTHQIWTDIERNLYSFEELKEILSDIYPAHHHIIDCLLDNQWEGVLILRDDPFQLVKKLQENQKNVYIMGNIIEEQANYLESIGFFSSFDGTVLSCESKMTTHDLPFYLNFLEQFQINKEETLFIVNPDHTMLPEIGHGKQINWINTGDLSTYLEEIEP